MKTIARQNGQLLNHPFHWANQLLDEAMMGSSIHRIPVNILELDALYKIELSVPGYEKSDFNLSIQKDQLSISALKKEEENVEQLNYIKREITQNGFTRTFHLPKDKLNLEEISASYNNGILSIHLPKKEDQTEVEKTIIVS